MNESKSTDISTEVHSTAVSNIERYGSVYGEYVRKSSICPVCTHKDHMDINLMRSRDHATIRNIALHYKITEENLTKHFKAHYLISPENVKLITLKEGQFDASNQIIDRILDGEVDIFSGARSVLESKAQRLNTIKTRFNVLSDKQDIDILTDEEKTEFILLSKEATKLENNIMEIYQILDKKLFPTSQQELSNAVLMFKLKILKKIVDNIILVLHEFEKDPTFYEIVQVMREALAPRINIIESDILKSGGVLTTDNSADS
jgi:hypothetical protein